MIDCLGNTVIAAAVTGLGIAAMASPAKALDGIQQAAVYSVDKAECRLYVPDEWIKRSLASAMIQYNLTLEQAIEQAGSLGTAIQMNVRESGLAGQYCARRVAQ
jgi:hypothetical protein